MMKRKYLRIICIGIVLILILSGCSSEKVKEEISAEEYVHTTEDTVKLIYYTIGNPDEDLNKVNDELNRILTDKYGITVDYRKVGWNDYNSRITNLVMSGGDFDIAFVAGSEQGDYAKHAEYGAWLDLTEFLEGEGRKLYSEISPLFWQGVTINGKIYGIPTNKEVAVPEYLMFAKEMLDKYNFDISSVDSIEDLEPMFKIIKENEPEYTVFEMDRNSNNFFAIDGYEYVISKEIPLMINYKDENPKVVNIYETDEAHKILTTLRDYYQKGYINEDASIRSGSALEKGRKVFCKMASGGPYSDISWSKDRGYEIEAKQVTASVATTESTRGAVMVINSLCKNKEACYRFLLAVNEDSEVRNLLNYGIPGTHYELDENNQVKTISDKYAGVQYTQGNWFILNTRCGEPLNKWDIYREFNSNVVASKLLGFVADTSKVEKELSGIRGVWEKYYSALMTGSVDVEGFLPDFISKLSDAGIDKVQNELQEQINIWSKENQEE